MRLALPTPLARREVPLRISSAWFASRRSASTLTERQKHLGAATSQWTWAEDDLKRVEDEVGLRKAAFPPDGIDTLRALRTRNRTLQGQVSEVAKKQNHLGGEMKRLMALRTHPDRPPDWETQVAQTKARAAEAKKENSSLAIQVERTLREALDLRLLLPNSTHSDAPRGPEANARIIAVGGPQELFPVPASDLVGKTVGQVADRAATSEKDHLAVAAGVPGAWGGVDMASGVTVAGSSWPYLLGRISMLEQALTQHALSLATQHGFLLVSPPEVVRTDVAARCGFNPRGETLAQTYHVNTGSENADPVDDLCLVGTAEIALGGLVAGKTFPPPTSGERSTGGLDNARLPLHMVALSHAFRAEAGARGADTRGLYRVHQFAKAELFVVCYAEDSDTTLEQLRGVQEQVIRSLGLPYRVLDMPSEELGASASRKYDMEVWMPGRGSWGEVSSASNCTDFQARRLQIKHRPRDPNDKLVYAHTLNATAAAIPRLIVALLENYGLTSDDPPRLRLPSSLARFWLAGTHDPLVEWISVDAQAAVAHDA